MPAGYSGTPTAKKLTLKSGMRVWFDAMPDTIRADIAEAKLDLTEVNAAEDGLHAAHLFVTTKADLEERLALLRPVIAKDGQVWVSWPKKTSRLATQIDQTAVRAAGHAAGFIDTKKCAVDETWSGLKFVIPKADR
ncbi:MAG: DUF3052 family protein [Pseudomonadota bacterium]